MLNVVDVDAIFERGKLVGTIKQAVQKLPMEIICLDVVLLNNGNKTLVLVLSKGDPDEAYVPEVVLLKNVLTSSTVEFWSIGYKGDKLYIRDLNEKDSKSIPLELSELDAFIELRLM